MSDALSARPYAAALLEIAKRAGTVDLVEGEMRDLQVRLEGAPELHTLLTAPALRTTQKLELADRTLGIGMSQLVQDLVHLLLRKRRIGIAGAVAQQYIAMAEAARGVVRGTLTTAVPLKTADTQAIMDKLGAVTGKSVLLVSIVDPSVLGGVRVRIQDVLFDHTVRHRLDELRADLQQVRVI